MNDGYDFKNVLDLQEVLMNLSYDKLDYTKKHLISSNFWTLDNKMNLHRLSFNILCAVTYRPKHIHIYSLLVSELIKSDCDIGKKFKSILMEIIFHSISQEIIFPNRVSHFTFLYYLYKQEVIQIDSIIREFSETIENTLSEKEMILFSYFSEQIKIENIDLYNLVVLYFVSFKDNIPIYLTEFTDFIIKQRQTKNHFGNELSEFNQLRNCIQNDDIEKLREIASNPEFNFNQRLSPSICEPSLILQNYPPILHYAAFYQSIKCFNFLLMNEADPFLKDGQNRSLPLFAVAGGSMEIIRIAEQRNLDFEGTLQAASLFHQNDVFLWLYESRFQSISLSSYCLNKKTILNEAALSNNLFIVKLCINHKVIINRTNSRKSTALHLAAGYNNYDVINFLLSLNHPKLDPNLINIPGMTPLMIAIQRKNIESINSFIFYLNKKSNPIPVNFEIRSEDSEGSFPIHLAAKTGSALLFSLILNNVSDPNVKQKYGFTPLHIAVSMHHTEIVKVLFSDKRVDVNAEDLIGWTPLHLAAQFGFVDIVTIFVNSIPRVNVSLKSKDEKTPLDLALNENRTEIIKLLK